MIKELFLWLDSSSYPYWATLFGGMASLFLWVVASFRKKHEVNCWHLDSKLIAGVVFLLALLGARWPYLFSATEYNPDESQIIAGAITLSHDLVFWRSVDGTTSGPLNFYALLPLHWIGAPLDYFTARIVGLALVWMALIFTYIGLTINYSILAARLAVLPAVTFFALVHEWDFVHYSSEHVSLCLFASAACLTVSGLRASGRNLHLSLGGLLAGLIPWAKLQATPLALALAVWGCWSCYRNFFDYTEKRKRAKIFLTSTLFPSVVILFFIWITGQTAVFVENYVFQNALYVGGGNSLAFTIASLSERAAETGLLPLFLLSQAVTLGICGVCFFRRRQSPDALWAWSAFFTVIAVISILVPGRGFLHYTLLLIIPLTLWSGTAMAVVFTNSTESKSRYALIGLFCFIGCLLPGGMRLAQPFPDMIGRLAYDWRYPRSALGNILHSSAQAGDTLAIWGWLPKLHVESKLPQATRVGYTYWSIVPSLLRDYHRKVFLEDLIRSRPTFFVDGVGAQSYYFQDRLSQAHEVFPELRDYIAANYSLVADLGHSRLFVKRASLGRASFEVSALKRAVALGRFEKTISEPREEFPPASHLARNTIGGHSVVMVPPPSQMGWVLKGLEKEFIFEYGYDPVAYQKPTQGNGTEIMVALEIPGQKSQVLFQQILDPAHVISHRGVQIAHVMIPSSVPGSRIVVKTGPGAYNDNSWDWAYIGDVRFRRYPHYALPDSMGKAQLAGIGVGDRKKDKVTQHP